MLSVGERLTLLSATLSTMPTFFMSTFMLSKWTIKEIDKIRRKFLWHGHKNQTRGIYVNPIAWHIVIKPKYIGGLGVLDLTIMN
jgi:hypothetical protein